MTGESQEDGTHRAERAPEDSERDGEGSDGGTREISDLIGVELTLALAAWFVLTLVAFFLIGPVVGLIVLFAGLIGFGWAAVAAIRRADTPD
jgi:hypothetical protein